MRTLVSSAATRSSATQTPAAFARRLRALRIALVVTLALAIPLVVALVTHSNRSGVENAYQSQARVEALAVARQAIGQPRAKLSRELKRLAARTPGLAGIAVYSGNREI